MIGSDQASNFIKDPDMTNSTSCGDGTWSALSDAVLGVPGVHITAVAETSIALNIDVETDQTLAGCPDCGVVAVGHGR